MAAKFAAIEGMMGEHGDMLTKTGSTRKASPSCGSTSCRHKTT